MPASLVEPRLTEIANRLRGRMGHTADPGVLAGRAGFPLFFLHYARYTGAPADQTHAESLVSELFETLPDEATLALCSGLAGAAWLLRYAVEQRMIDADADAVLHDLDTQLAEHAVSDMEDGNWDYLHGALGCAAYLLAAARRDDVRASLSAILDSLDRQAIRDDVSSRRWRNAMLEAFREDSFDGVSHGVPGIAGVLTGFIRNGIEVERATALLREALANIESRRHPRLAWCYGDPGIAMVQLNAFQETGETSWRDLAVRALGTTSHVRGCEAAGIEDATLCHGASGLSLMFARAHQQLGDEVLADAAVAWLHDSLAAPLPDDAPDSVLMGDAGLGLVLMALSSNQPPVWDRLLLIS